MANSKPGRKAIPAAQRKSAVVAIQMTPIERETLLRSLRGGLDWTNVSGFLQLLCNQIVLAIHAGKGSETRMKLGVMFDVPKFMLSERDPVKSIGEWIYNVDTSTLPCVAISFEAEPVRKYITDHNLFSTMLAETKQEIAKELFDNLGSPAYEDEIARLPKHHRTQIRLLRDIHLKQLLLKFTSPERRGWTNTKQKQETKPSSNIQ